MELRVVLIDLNRLQGIARNCRGQQGLEGIAMDLKGLKGISRDFMGFNPHQAGVSESLIRWGADLPTAEKQLYSTK